MAATLGRRSMEVTFECRTLYQQSNFFFFYFFIEHFSVCTTNMNKSQMATRLNLVIHMHTWLS